MVQTRSQARSSGTRLPDIHGANKGLDPHVQPGKKKSFPIQTINKGLPTHPIPKPRIGQGRARLRRKVKAQHHPIDPAQIPSEIGPKIQHRPTPSYHDPYSRPPPKPPDISDPLDSRKDLLDNDSDRKIRNRRKFTI